MDSEQQQCDDHNMQLSSETKRDRKHEKTQHVQEDDEVIKLSDETKDFIRREFMRLAPDGNLVKGRLEKCLQTVGLDPDCFQLDWLIKRFDSSGDGILQVDELMENLPTLHARSVKIQELKSAFELFDKNKDGYIRLPELKRILAHEGGMNGTQAGEKLDEYINKFDRNQDGKFNYCEFVDIYESERSIREIVTNKH